MSLITALTSPSDNDCYVFALAYLKIYWTDSAGNEKVSTSYANEAIYINDLPVRNFKRTDHYMVFGFCECQTPAVTIDQGGYQ